MTSFLQGLGLRLITLGDPIRILHDDNKNAYCQNEAGKLTGINLVNRALENGEFEQIFGLDLSELRAINLRANASLSTAIFPASMPKLERIEASECALTEFRLPDTSPELQNLDLRKNKLTRISFRGVYPRMTYLDLSENQLDLLHLHKGLIRLKHLYLNDNKLETLDRIGTVIYFGDHEELKDWVILNPNWIKNILYLVIDSPLASKGKLSPEALAVIWKDYSEEQHKKFLELMKAYHFCYSQQGAHGIEYVVPACLLAEKPVFPKHLKIPDYQLKCAFDPFIPAGTVNKFMVFLQGAEKGETHRGFIREKELPEVRQMEVSVFRDYMWRNNVIVQALEFRAYAHIEEVWQDKAVYINLFGKEAKPLFQFIVEALQSIIQRTKQSKYLKHLEFETKAWYKEDWEKLDKLQNTYQVDYFSSADKKTMHNKEYVTDLIMQNRLKEALEAIKDQNSSPHIQSQAISLLRRLIAADNGRMNGTVSFENQQMQRNQIAEAIITLNIAKEIELSEEPREIPTPKEKKADNSPTGKRKILFLAANPRDQRSLGTDQEFQRIKSELLQGKGRDAFEFLAPEFGVTTSVLLRARNERPQIVHFSGHGEKEGIMITTEQNYTQVIPTKALKRLFKPLVGITEIIILNACYSKDQAQALSEFGMFVVGNNLEIKDSAAISFSKGLYNGLGEGKDFEDAFNDAMFVVETEAPDSGGIIEVWKDGVILDL